MDKKQMTVLERLRVPGGFSRAAIFDAICDDFFIFKRLFGWLMVRLLSSWFVKRGGRTRSVIHAFIDAVLVFYARRHCVKLLKKLSDHSVFSILNDAKIIGRRELVFNNHCERWGLLYELAEERARLDRLKLINLFNEDYDAVKEALEMRMRAACE